MGKIIRSICIDEKLWDKIRVYSVQNKISISSLIEHFLESKLKEEKK